MGWAKPETHGFQPQEPSLKPETQHETHPCQNLKPKTQHETHTLQLFTAVRHYMYFTVY